jgi:hypothetical protein
LSVLVGLLFVLGVFQTRAPLSDDDRLLRQDSLGILAHSRDESAGVPAPNEAPDSVLSGETPGARFVTMPASAVGRVAKLGSTPCGGSLARHPRGPPQAA